MVEAGPIQIFILLLASMTKFSILKNELLRLDREAHHLEFLTTCRDIGLVPKFLTSRSNFLSKNFPRDKFLFETRCLKSIIRMKHALLNSIYMKIYGVKNNGLYRDYADFAVNGVFDHSMRVIQEYRDSQQTELQSRLTKKIEHLSTGLKSFNRSNRNIGFLNLSKHCFTERETRILNKGPKYITGSKIKPIDFVPQLEDIVKNVSPDRREELRCHIFLSYSKHLKMSSNLSFHENKLIRTMKSIPNITFLSTDKSNRIAIMDTAEYIHKMEDTIKNMKCDIITNDPLPSIVYKTTKIVKNFKTAEWPDEIRKIAKINPLGIIPKIFGVLKDHKVNYPLRPIVMRCSATTYFIEKALVIILKEFLPPSDHVLTSTSDFIQKLQQLNLPNQFFMFSLDVVSLYPSIEMDKARNNISNILQNNLNLSSTMKDTIISAINLIVHSNYFIFNKCIYQQKTGAPMGSPISGIIAEFILRPLEQSFLATASIKPICWYRYVDDVFGLWSSSSAEFLNFFTSLNNQDQAIQFTKEVENNNQLPYLDVLLTREEDSIKRSIYRKPNNTLCTIPKQATAPKVYKQAAYRSYIKRAMIVCSPETIHEELNNIRKIAIDNGFSLDFINNLIKRTNQQQQHPPTNPNARRVAIQYIEGFHEKISHLVKPYGIHLIARTNHKLKDILKTKIDSIPDMMIPGVYEIPIIHPNNQVTHYIGQTARKLYIRIKEHKNDLKKGKLTSAIYKAFSENPSIKIMFEDAHIVAPYTSSSRTIMRESLEIHIRGNKVCNEQDSFSIPNIWLTLFK